MTLGRTFVLPAPPDLYDLTYERARNRRIEEFLLAVQTAAGGNSGTIPDGDYGDITVSGGGTVWTLDGDSVAHLNLFTSLLKGIVPASGGGATNFLRADVTWAAPPLPPSVASVAPIADIATLQAVTTTSFPYVSAYVISWRTSRFAKGGGIFNYDSTDSTTADDGFITIVDASGRRWKRDINNGVDAYMAGAYGDGSIDGSGNVVTTGTHDDTAAINKVIAYLKANVIPKMYGTPVEVSLGAGAFRCDGTVNAVSLANSRWDLGAQGTIILSRAAGLPAFDLSDSDGADIHNLDLYGDPANRPAVGLFICRTAGTSKDFHLDRPTITGEFLYAGLYNANGENVIMDNAWVVNNYEGDCYATAVDSVTYLRYDPPVAGTVTASNPLKITKTAHGLVTGNMVYPIEITGITGYKHRCSVTVIDANNFTLDGVNGTGAGATCRYYKARFWSASILPVNDTIEPYIGNGQFAAVINGGQCQCPKGKACILDTPGGRRNYDTRCMSGFYGATGTSDIVITSVTAATDTFVTGSAHGLAVNDIAWVDGTSVVGNNKKLYKVATTPTTTSLTVIDLDGSAIVTFDASGGTIRKQDTHGGYAIHILANNAMETTKYENIHHENGSTNACKSFAYIQSIDALQAGSGTQQVIFKGMRYTEHTTHENYGQFELDTGTVSSIILSGSITVADFASDFGNGVKAGKFFLSPSLWTVRGDLYLDSTDSLSSSVNFIGRLFNTHTGAYVFYTGPSKNVPKTTSYTVLPSDINTSFTNEGSGASITFTLPDAVDGMEFEFAAIDAQIIVVRAVGNDTFTLGTTTGASAGAATSSGVQFTSIKIRAQNSRRWLIEGGNNTAAWTIT